jgi:hypothetical protein
MVTGAIIMGFAIAGLFFLRFWRETHDRLFAFFASAFFILAVSRAAFGLMILRDSHGDYLYWVRLVAFSMILVAILDKNMVKRTSDS